jgi:ABC-2 type transport system permease protein
VTALLRAELLKLRTTRSAIAYPAVLALLAGLGAAAQVGAARDAERPPDFQPELVAIASIAALVAFVLGIVAVTAEFRHGTITPTFLTTPVRERVLAAKGLVCSLAGGAFAVGAIVVVAAVAVPWLLALDVPLALDDGDVWTRALRVTLAVALWGALGVAVGAVVHSQVGAILGAFGWLLVLEPLVGGLLSLAGLEGAGQYLPGSALDAIAAPPEEELLGFWPGLGLSALYLAALGALGVLRTRRRDVS